MIQSSLLNILRQNQIDAIRASVDSVIDDSEYDEFTIPLESIPCVTDVETPLSSSEAPIWKLLQDRKMKIEVLSHSFQTSGEHVTDICDASHLDLRPELTESSHQAVLQECEIISQQVNQVLLESQKQSLERAHVLQDLSNVTKDMEYLISEADDLVKDSQSFSLQVSNLTRDFQRIEEQVSENECNLNKVVSELEDIRAAVLKNSQKLSDLEEASEARKRISEVVISRIQSENDEMRDRVIQIDELQRKIIRDQEALRFRENELVGSSKVDFLKDKLLEATSMAGGAIQNVVRETVETFKGATDIIPSFQEVRGTISTLQEQVKEIPSLVKGIVKESMVEAAAFLWDNFTNVAWNTISAISKIAKIILQYPQAAYSYIARNVSVVFDRVNLSLIALGILSGCAFIVTGTPFTFGATAVVGYLIIRGSL